MPSLRFTKSAVDKIPFTTAGQKIYRDTHLRGLGFLVGTTKKFYFVESQVSHRTRRVAGSTGRPFPPLWINRRHRPTLWRRRRCWR